MPIYEYECDKCKSRFEIQRGFNEEGGNCCPRCGGEGRQVFLPTPIIFKGSGFYITDSRKKEDHSTEVQTAKPEAEKAAKKGDAGESKAKPATDKVSPKTEPAKPAAKAQPDK